MKKTNYSLIFLILLTGFSLLLGNIPMTVHIKTPKSPDSMEINPVPAAMQLNIGAWIIVAGDRESDHALVDRIKQGSDIAYFILVSRGFAASDIKYLGPAWETEAIYTSAFQEDVATLANIEDAITNWAAPKVGPTQALGIYLFDHGGTNSMAIPGPNLSDADLNAWLDDLETSTGCNRMFILYEACHAGSFINPVSKNNRIVITSTSSAGSAWPSPTWAWFSEEFFSSIVQCKTIGECFEDAVAYVNAVGAGGTQFPMIDDNHDETGNQVDAWGNLPNGGDGSDALNYWIGTGSNCPVTLIQWLPLKAYVSVQAPIAPMWAVIPNFTKIEEVYVRVIPPGWVPPTPPEDNDGVKMIPDGIQPQYLYDRDGDGNFTGNIALMKPGGGATGIGTPLGDYILTFHARSNDGTVADIKSTYIILNEDGTAPEDTTPPTIEIINPEDGETIDGSVKIKASGDDDQALAKIQIYFDDELVKEEDMPPYLPYPEVSYRFDTEDYEDGDYTIMAKAIDTSDNEATHSIEVEIKNEPEGGPIIPGFTNASLLFGSLFGVAIIFVQIKRKKVGLNC